MVCSNRGPVMASSLGAWLWAQVEARLGACSSRLRSPASASFPSTDLTGTLFSLKREALTEYEALVAANRPGRAADNAAEAIRVLAEENIVSGAVERWFPGEVLRLLVKREFRGLTKLAGCRVGPISGRRGDPLAVSCMKLLSALRKFFVCCSKQHKRTSPCLERERPLACLLLQVTQNTQNVWQHNARCKAGKGNVFPAAHNEGTKEISWLQLSYTNHASQFMQRSAASAAAAQAAVDDDPQTPSPKRARLSAPSSPANNADLQAVNAALAEEERKRAEAVARQAAEAGESEWVLDFQGPGGVPGATQPVIVAADSLDGEFEDSGRMSFGGFKPKKKSYSMVNIYRIAVVSGEKRLLTLS